MRIALGLLAIFATGAACAQQLPVSSAPGVPVEVAAETALEYDVPASLPAIEGTPAGTHAPQFLNPRETSASPLPAPSPQLLEGFALDANLELAEQPSRNPAFAKYRRSKRTKPGEERVKLIQRILQVRGYLPGEDAVDGDWGPKSKEALKRFQQDHGLTPDGKLGAWSLRALGLGPRHAQVPQGATLGEVLRKAKGLPATGLGNPKDTVEDNLQNAAPVLVDAADQGENQGDDLGSVPPDIARDMEDASEDPIALAGPANRKRSQEPPDTDDDGGIAQISRGESKIFLTNPPFRSMHGNAGTVLIWFNVNSKQEVSRLHEEWTRRGAKILSELVEKPWLLFEFTAGDWTATCFAPFTTSAAMYK